MILVINLPLLAFARPYEWGKQSSHKQHTTHVVSSIETQNLPSSIDTRKWLEKEIGCAFCACILFAQPVQGSLKTTFSPLILDSVKRHKHNLARFDIYHAIRDSFFRL